MFLVGEPGSGKSQVGYNLAAAIGGGAALPPFRSETTTQGRVLILAAEQNEARVKDRLAGPIRQACVPKGAVEVWSLGTNPAHVDLVEHGDELRSLIARENFATIILDPFSELSSADENSRTDVRGVTRVLRGFVAAGAAVIVVHHSRKLPQNGRGPMRLSLSDVRGSGALTGAANTILAVEQIGEGAVQSRCLKANYASRDQSFVFRLDWPSGLLVPAPEAKPLERTNGVARRAHDVLVAAGVAISAKQVADAMPCAKATAQRALDALVREGAAVVAGAASRNTKLYAAA